MVQAVALPCLPGCEARSLGAQDGTNHSPHTPEGSGYRRARAGGGGHPSMPSAGSDPSASLYECGQNKAAFARAAGNASPASGHKASSPFVCEMHLDREACTTYSGQRRNGARPLIHQPPGLEGRAPAHVAEDAPPKAAAPNGMWRINLGPGNLGLASVPPDCAKARMPTGARLFLRCATGVDCRCSPEGATMGWACHNKIGEFSLTAERPETLHHGPHTFADSAAHGSSELTGGHPVVPTWTLGNEAEPAAPAPKCTRGIKQNMHCPSTRRQEAHQRIHRASARRGQRKHQGNC